MKLAAPKVLTRCHFWSSSLPPHPQVLYLSPAMTRWKERSFFHVVPPHRYSYQSFGRQMVAAQQVANILTLSRTLTLTLTLIAGG